MLRALTLAALATLPATAADFTLQPGVITKIYALGVAPKSGGDVVDYGKEWPAKVLPDAPGEILILPQIPRVRPPSPKKYFEENAESNLLITPKTSILHGVNFYTVEFEGFLQSTSEGVYSIGVTSDDPVKVFIEGRQILSQDEFANPNFGRTRDNEEWFNRDQTDHPDCRIQTFSTQGSALLSANKAYHVVVLCQQAVTIPCRNRYHDRLLSRDLNRGAFLDVSFTTPEGKTGPLPLVIPVAK